MVLGWKTGVSPATTPARPATGSDRDTGSRPAQGRRGSGSASLLFRQGGVHFGPGQLRDGQPLAPADAGEGFAHAAAQLRRPGEGLGAAGGLGDGIEDGHGWIVTGVNYHQ